ncbi:hypothetical protein BL250_04995 [Erwinia sp. OLTSP20]|nr:hypothetical protein BL250_04995 [Erwinia sp. OLTSP20]
MTESYDDGFDVQFTNNTHIYWMQFGAGYNNRMELFNLLKTAYLTQAPIDVCVNNDGLFFIGASMKVY